MNRLRVFITFTIIVSSCLEPTVDIKRSFLDQCTQNPALEMCQPLEVAGLKERSIRISKKLGILLKENTTRPMQDQCAVFEGSIFDETRSCISDKVIARIKQPGRNLEVALGREHISIVTPTETENSGAQKTSQLSLWFRSEVLYPLIVGEPTILEIELTDWKGTTRISSTSMVTIEP